MIVKSYHIPTSDSLSRTRAHLFRGEENEAVHVLRGTEADLQDFRQPALAVGCAYAIRHFILAPELELTELQYLAVVDDLAKEFGFDSALCVAILHRKPRRTEASRSHLHVLVPEVDPVAGGVLSSSHDYLRHEWLSRQVEWRYGHPLREGAHLDAILRRLAAEGQDALYHALSAAFPRQNAPLAAYTGSVAAKAKRVLGFDVPALKHALREAWAADPTPEGLARWIAGEALVVRAGDQPKTLVVEKAGIHLGSLNRLLELPKAACYKELHHVPALVPQFAERQELGPDDPSGNEIASRCSGTRISGTRRRGRGPREDARGDAGSGPPGGSGPERERGSAASEDRASRHQIARQRASVLRLAVDDTQRRQLATQRASAIDLGRSAYDACLSWIEQQRTEIGREKDALRAFDPDPERRVEARRRDIETTARLVEETRIEFEQKALRLQKVREARVSWFRRLIDRKRLDGERAKVEREVSAASGRFEDAKESDQDARNILRREIRNVENRRANADANRPRKMLEIEQRLQRIASIERRLRDEPEFRFVGAAGLQALVAEWSSLEPEEHSIRLPFAVPRMPDAVRP